MKLWTIQPLSFYNELVEKGEIFSSIDNVEETFIEAYKWLIEEMKLKVSPKPFDSSSPIWGWYQYDNINSKRPDLRNSGLLPKGTQGVRIEFNKPEHDALLSDFNLWHYVLNYWCITDNEEQDKEFDNILKRLDIDFKKKENYPKEIKDLIKRSWSKIFDMNYNCEYSTTKFEDKMIQATFWSLKRSEIIKVDHFIAR